MARRFGELIDEGLFLSLRWLRRKRPKSRRGCELRRSMIFIPRPIASSSETEVEVFRFPNQLCTDKGRAIIQQEPGWEKTLTGAPKEIYQLWEKYFRPRGYKLKVQIVDYPDGMPGDIGMTLSWA
jgi:hypothetical protein